MAATPTSIDGGATIGTAYWPDGDTPTGGQGQTVAGLDCGVMDETYHVHSHLSILLDGVALVVPADIGVVQLSPSSGCTYPLHTHEHSGKIHVEAPEPGTFTLGQFFAIWGQPLEASNVAGFTGLPVVVYVTDDGIVGEADDWPAIELISHREITIQIGTPISEIPNIVWSGT